MTEYNIDEVRKQIAKLEFVAGTITGADGRVTTIMSTMGIDAANQILSLLKPLIEQARQEGKGYILNQMALERCDPDVMPYFEDYYYLPKSVWQALSPTNKGQ